MKRVTFLSMLHTDGANTSYGVYQGNLRKDNTINFCRTTTKIAVLSFRNHKRPCYACTINEYATPEVPAIPWRGHKDHDYFGQCKVRLQVT
mgnify:CR=1 FL=1